MTRTADHSEWYLDEPLMWAFIRQGGTSPEHHTKMRKILEDWLVLHSLREGEEIGYIDVEAPLGAERMLWMFRTPELRYLPLMLPNRGEVRLLDDASGQETVQKLENLSPAEFLDRALSGFLIVRADPRGSDS